MASDARVDETPEPRDDSMDHIGTEIRKVLRTAWGPLASLKLTVVLFALGILIILVGTLAQVRQDMWEVMSDYFRSGIARVEVSVFFPENWFPNLPAWAQRMLVALAALGAAVWGSLPCLARNRRHPAWGVAGCLILLLGLGIALKSLLLGWFWMPGGATIGAVLLVNLVAAHGVRFTIQARGLRLAMGLAVTALGAVLTWQVIASGHNPDGLQAVPVFPFPTLWLLCKVGLLMLLAAMLARLGWMLIAGGRDSLRLQLLGGATMLVAGLSAWLWLGGEAAYLGDSGMRILWQLIQGEFVSLVLLLGCWLVFAKRGGTVLIHAGIGLLMFGEWFVSWYAVEERLIIQEGQSANYALDIRETELAVVDPAFSDTEEDVVVISGRALQRNAQGAKTLQHEALPFDVRVDRYFKNSELRDVKPDLPNPATAGSGLQLASVEVDSSSGTDTERGVDMAACYVTLLRKGSQEPLGTYMLSQYLSSQDMSDKVALGDKNYEVSLRFKRTYKPYTMQLLDVRKDDYLGTSTPRNYSSEVRLVDPSRNIERDHVRIWMNNPLRYAGETFYQSGYQRDPRTGVETTTLQVVTNTGWMIPYVSCMLVGTGMFAHFWILLMRFLQRRQRGGQALPPAQAAFSTSRQETGPESRRPETGRRGRQPPPAASPAGQNWLIADWLVPLVAGLLCLYWVFDQSQPRRAPSGEFNWVEFGKLPVVYEGRVKPIDTVARNALRKISDYETYRDGQGQRQPAVRWLLDVIARPETAEQHQVFRIYNLEVLQTLGLERRQGFHYSLAEIRGADGEVREELRAFDQETEKARQVDEKGLTFYQRKLLEVDGRFRTYTLLASAFQPEDFGPLPTKEELAQDREGSIQRIMALINRASQTERMLERMQVPLAVPDLLPAPASPQEAAAPWLPYASAVHRALLRKVVSSEPDNPATTAWQAIFAAYARQDAVTFNRAVREYRELLTRNPPEELSLGVVRFESYYNYSAPVYQSMALCVIAFLLAAFAWLGFSKPLNRAALVVLLLAFAVLTFALVARMVISGRPPVTNLYSSAVFIGWACILFGLVMELLYRNGVGCVEAAVSGFAALIIAQFLGLRGDTFTVLQAVLDTQFWLATHVVAITLGYAATYAAGLLGVVYVLRGFFTPSLTAEDGKTLARMIYGVTCYAIFFSFVGTVLGGLWADDSWGRFWGWDPKENGALIIVLWSALVLHARWDGMVRDRGLAVLAVGGNIVTSWSWFGVNELSVGLHSYGFTEGVLLVLGLFVASQAAIIALGCLPKELWWSFRRQQAVPAAALAEPQ